MSKSSFHYANLAQGEVLVQCPYDKSHVLVYSKLGNHLAKCRKNYIKKMNDEGKVVEFGICQYTTAHIIITAELDFHEKHCPSKNQPPPNFDWDTTPPPPQPPMES